MSITPEQAVAQAIRFAGNPDTVYRQIIDFGNLHIIDRSGFLTHAEAIKGIKMFAREVLPRFEQGKAEVHRIA